MGLKNTSRDLAQDLINSTQIREGVLDKAYAHKLYSALCNTVWQPAEVMDILREHTWSASWRTAGGIVAELRKPTHNEDYIDWYCSGHEGYVHPDIREDLKQLGWTCVEEDDVNALGGIPPENKWGTRTGIAGSLSEVLP